MSAILKTVNFNGSNGSHFFIRLYCETITQYRNPKKSIAHLALSVGSHDAYSGSGSVCSCYINGVYAGSFSSIPSYSETVVAVYDAEYTHSTAEDLIANYSASVSINWSGLAQTNLAGTFTIPRIWDNITGKSNQVVGYSKDSIWKLRKFYFKNNGVWKSAKVLYKKEGEWI